MRACEKNTQGLYCSGDQPTVDALSGPDRGKLCQGKEEKPEGNSTAKIGHEGGAWEV